MEQLGQPPDDREADGGRLLRARFAATRAGMMPAPWPWMSPLMRHENRLLLLLFVAMTAGCATEGRRSPARPPASCETHAERLSLPSLGISLPTPPRGWIAAPARVGSIGAMLLAGWLKPAGDDPRRASAGLTLVLANPRGFGNAPANLRLESCPPVDGKPCTRMTWAKGRATTRNTWEGAWVSERLLEGYRLEAHGMLFLLALQSEQDSDLETLRTVVRGIRWTAPRPAYEALALSGQLSRVRYDAALWFDVPYPFVNNPFRGDFYDPQTLVAAAAETPAADADMQVHELKGVSDLAAALAAARDTPDYYETRGWDFTWQQVSRDPDVRVGVTAPTPPDKEGTMWLHKAIVARAADGRYYRVLFAINGRDPRAMQAYAAIADKVAGSITTVPPPPVWHAER